MDDEDICHIAHIPFSGTAAEMLKCRFLLEEAELYERGDLGYDEYVLLHREAIKRHSGEAGKHYRRYIEKLHIRSGSKVGFFDLISSGTCQKALDNVVDFDLHGLYFVHMGYDAQYKNNTGIDALFGRRYVHVDGCELLNSHVLFETVMTSEEPSLASFDCDGNPVFREECRTAKQLQDVRDIHSGILGYIRNTKIKMDDLPQINTAVPDLLLQFLHPQYSNVFTDYFSNVLSNEFSNEGVDSQSVRHS
jgi:hypothetical protein